MESSRPLGAVHWIADLDAALEAGLSGPALIERARELLRAGLPSLQLRGKRSSRESLRRIGRALAAEVKGSGAVLVVNDDPHLALELDAGHVHLAAGRDLAGLRASHPGLRFGQSCHDETELAAAALADWVFVSPIFPTDSKPGATPLGVRTLARLVAVSRAPVYALGGVDAGNAPDCLRAGAAGVAAIRALLAPGGEALVILAARTVATPAGEHRVDDEDRVDDER